MRIKVYTEIKNTFEKYLKCNDKPIIYYGSLVNNYFGLITTCNLKNFETIYNSNNGNNCNLNDYIKNGRNKIIIITNTLNCVKDIDSSSYYLVNIDKIEREINPILFYPQ